MIFCILGFLLACLANEQSVQIGGIDRSREAAAVCIGHSKGIRRVAELVQQHDLAKKLVLHEVMLKPLILFIDVVIKELPASSTSPIPFWIIIFA